MTRPSAERSTTWRAPRRPVLWDELVASQRRVLWEHLAWPLVAIIQLGFLGYLLVPQDEQGLWAFLILLTLSGSVLGVTGAVVVGSLAFLVLGFWLYANQLDQGLEGIRFLIMALTPFAPLWLAALRERQRETARLDALLKLPQVRASMEVSDWSLLPMARVIDRRLAQHEAEQKPGDFTPVWIWRFRLTRFEEELELFGWREMQHRVMGLADGLRQRVRTGDYIAEDLRASRALYVLAFPNPENLNKESLDQRLNRAVARSDLPGIEIATGVIPHDGNRLHNLVWQVEEGPG